MRMTRGRGEFFPTQNLSAERSFMSNQAGETKKSQSKWSSYTTEIYASRRPPQPLGTVVPEDIEKQAKEKLKDYPGKFILLTES